MQITLNVPEQYVTEKDAAEWARRIALYAAMLMFREGELSAGAAAELAGVDRHTFTSECQRHGISSVDYEPEDLQGEIDSLRQAS